MEHNLLNLFATFPGSVLTNLNLDMNKKMSVRKQTNEIVPNFFCYIMSCMQMMNMTVVTTVLKVLSCRLSSSVASFLDDHKLK